MPAERKAQVPIESIAQRKAMYAAAEGKSALGIPKKVGAEFVSTDKPGKLPEHKSKMSKLYDRKKD